MTSGPSCATSGFALELGLAVTLVALRRVPGWLSASVQPPTMGSTRSPKLATAARAAFVGSTASMAERAAIRNGFCYE